MRQTRTRILSLLLALMMCLSLLPMTAMAATGEPTLFLDPNQDPNSNMFFAYADQGTSFLSGTISGNISGSTERYTVRLFLGDNVTDTPIESRTCDKGTLTIDLSAHGRYGYELISVSPSSTVYTVSPDKKLTLTLTTDTDIFVKSVLLDDNFTFTFNMNGVGEDRVYPVKYGDAFPTPPEPPFLPGYRFLGWYSGRLADDHYLHSFANINAYESKVDMDYTFYAMWEKEEVAAALRVTFYPNGGRITEFKGKTVPAPNGGYPFTVDDVTGVDMNSGIGWTNTESSGLLTATVLPSVEREGYTFDGWYFTSTGPEANQAYDGKLTDFSKLTKFDPDKSISVLTVLAAKWVESGETYTVKFDLNGMPGTTPSKQEIPKGGTVKLPEVAVPDRGIEFVSWCTRESDGLHIWDAKNPVTHDLTLYAGWQAVRIPSEDTFQFNNSSRYFNNYHISKTYYDYLVDGEPTTYKERIKALHDRKWNGSCFGMSAVYCMGRAGQIGLDTFQNGAKLLSDLQYPILSTNVQDLINFYMLTQKTYACTRYHNEEYYFEDYNTANCHIRSDTSRNQKIVDSIEGKPNFALLAFSYNNGKGHAIAARSVSRGTDGNYHIEIWDPNYPSTFGEVIISSDYSRVWFGEKTMNSGEYNIGTELSYLMPISQKAQSYDAKNLESVFGKNVAPFAQVSNSTIYTLSSSVADFSVTTADGRSAMVKGGKQVSGDLPLVRDTLRMGDSDDYSYIVGTNTFDDFTVAVGGKQAEVEFLSNDILVRVSAGNLNSVEVNGNSIITSCTSSSQQEITVVSDSLGDTWNKVTASGKDTGFTLAVESGQLKVGSKNNVSVSVQGENVDTWETSGKQTVNVPPSGTAVAMSSLGAGTQKPAGNNPFTDVKAGAYYYDAVLWAVENKVTSGTSATTFSPDASCTRGQIVTFLWRAAGSPKPSSTNNPFTDVKEGTYYYDAVLWAVEKGITSGTSATTFNPDASCTRGQTVTFLYRAAGSPKAASSTNPFTDVKSGTYYYDAVLWAVEQKVTSGTSATTFSPDAIVTRGQTVTFLYRSQGK